VILVLAIVAEGIGILLARSNFDRLDTERLELRAEVKRLEGPIRLAEALALETSRTERKLRVAECFQEEGALSPEASRALPRLRRALQEARP